MSLEVRAHLIELAPIIRPAHEQVQKLLGDYNSLRNIAAEKPDRREYSLGKASSLELGLIAFGQRTFIERIKEAGSIEKMKSPPKVSFVKSPSEEEIRRLLEIWELRQKIYGNLVLGREDLERRTRTPSEPFQDEQNSLGIIHGAQEVLTLAGQREVYLQIGEER
jgi:hypothetical protein